MHGRNDLLRVLLRRVNDQGWSAHIDLRASLKVDESDRCSVWNPFISVDGQTVLSEAVGESGIGEREIWMVQRTEKECNWSRQ